MSSMNNVKFPDTGELETDWKNTGEGGLFVYAVVRDTREASKKDESYVDTFCVLKNPDVCVSHSSYTRHNEDSLWFPVDGSSWEVESSNLRACVLLDTHWASLHNGIEYFSSTMDDLTDSGYSLVQALSYLGEVELVTFLDT